MLTHLRRLRLDLSDGAQTTAYVATYPLATTRMNVVRMPQLAKLGTWCADNDVDEALVGGFYLRTPRTPDDAGLTGLPLGELRLDGVVQPGIAFTAPWGARRASVHVDGHGVRIARREELPHDPAGDLLQAGPMLVSGGAIVVSDDEGFSAGADQFDSDITDGRHPRAALGYDATHLIALACDGRDDGDAGMTIGELAQAMADLGARDALNLDGGGSTSIVCGGKLQNIPRESHGVAVPGGREIATALVFTPA